MSSLLPLILLSATLAIPAPQTPAPAPPQQPTAPAPAPETKPAAPRPRAAAPAATGTLTVNVTDGGGLPVQGVAVRASGPLDREGSSLAGGIVRFLSMKPGDYRLRFSHPKYVLLERDVTVRGSQTIDVMLSSSPQAEEKPAPAPPPPAPAANAPPGDPKSVAVVDFIERNFISGRDPLKEDPLGCTASAKTTLVQVRDPLPERALPDADEVIYVVAGEGTLRLGNSSISLVATTLAVIPRGTVRGLSRKGRNPLIFVSVLSGPPCTR